MLWGIPALGKTAGDQVSQQGGSRCHSFREEVDPGGTPARAKAWAPAQGTRQLRGEGDIGLPPSPCLPLFILLLLLSLPFRVPFFVIIPFGFFTLGLPQCGGLLRG